MEVRYIIMSISAVSPANNSNQPLELLLGMIMERLLMHGQNFDQIMLNLKVQLGKVSDQHYYMLIT